MVAMVPSGAPTGLSLAKVILNMEITLDILVVLAALLHQS
jgi:hypothetical protein